MTVVIGEREFPTVDELEGAIKKRGMDSVQAQKARLAHQREVFTARRRDALGRHPDLARAGSLVSAGLNFGNTVGLGAPSAAAAGITAPLTAVKRGISLGDAFDLNRAQGDLLLGASPTSQTVGTVAAFFTPGSAAKGAANLGFKAAGGERLAKLAADSTHLGKSALLQLSSAMAGSAGAITAINVGEGVFDERSATDVAGDILGQVTSPTNIALAAGSAGLVSTIRARPDRAAVELVNKARNILPGFRATPDMLRPEGGFFSGIIDSISVSPAGRRAVAKYLSTAVYKPLGAAVSAMRGAVTPRGAGRRGEDLTEAAAKDIRRLLVSPRGKAGEGVIGKRIAAAGDRGFAEAARAGDVVPRSQAAHLLRTFRALEKRAKDAAGTEGAHGSEYSGVIKNLRGAIKEAGKSMRSGGEWNLTPQMLDNLRQRLAPIAKFDANRGGAVPIGARDIRDAKRMYRAVREVQRRSSPPIDNALKDIKELRDLNAAFRPIDKLARTGDDIDLVRGMFSAPDFLNRWKAATRLLKADQLQRIRGAYLAEFLEELTLQRGIGNKGEFLLNERLMLKMFRGKSGGRQYRKKVFDTILPGVREEITGLSAISDLVMRTAGRAEGSATARRTMDAAVLAGAFDTAKMAVSAVRDPGLGKVVVGRLLGAAGIFGFTETLLNGRLANIINRAASGGTLQPGRSLPAAASQVNGLGGLGRAGLGVVENTGDALGSLF